MKNHEIIFYNSEEFEKFEEKSKIKLSDAWEIQKEYAVKTNIPHGNWLFFVIDGNYAFTSIFQPKIPEASTGGIWVNSETGEVIQISNTNSLRYRNAYNGDGKEFPF